MEIAHQLERAGADRRRMLRPLGTPRQAITVRRRVSCERYVSVKRFRPSRSGRFELAVEPPKGQTTAVHRFSTRVRNTTRSRKLYRTLTLLRAVTLH